MRSLPKYWLKTLTPKIQKTTKGCVLKVKTFWNFVPATVVGDHACPGRGIAELVPKIACIKIIAFHTWKHRMIYRARCVQVFKKWIVKIKGVIVRKRNLVNIGMNKFHILYAMFLCKATRYFDQWLSLFHTVKHPFCTASPYQTELSCSRSDIQDSVPCFFNEILCSHFCYPHRSPMPLSQFFYVRWIQIIESAVIYEIPDRNNLKIIEKY